MFVPYPVRFKVLLIIAFVYLLEYIFESSVVFLQDRVLGAHVERQWFAERQLEACVGEPPYRVVGIVLCLCNTTTILKIVDMDAFRLAACRSEYHLQSAIALGDIVLGSVLVPESMTAYDDGLLPTWNKAWNPRNNDGFPENGAASATTVSGIVARCECPGTLQMIPDRSIR